MQAGYVAQPKQLRFHALARLADEPGGPTEIGYGGARGGGKSHCVLAQVALDDCQREDGIKALLLRKVGKAVRESFEDLRGRVLAGVPNDYRRQEGSLSFRNGSRIILGHFKNESDVDSYLGLEYDVIAVEEATMLSSQKYKTIRTCLRTSKPAWRPRMYSTTNPGGVGHGWYKAAFIQPWRAGGRGDSGPGETRFVASTVDDNAFVNVEYRGTLDKLTGWQKRAWRFGDWEIAAGQFFTTWREDVHVVPAFRVSDRAVRRVWGALDYGFTHYTVAHILAEDSDGRVYVMGEHAERRWLPSRHVEGIRSLVHRLGLRLEDVEQWVIGADAFSRERDGRCVADDYADAGLRLELANMDRIQGAAELLRRLGDPDAHVPPTLFVADTCARLIECMPGLEHDPYRPEDVLKVDMDEDGAGGDDAYDALRYGVMALAGIDRRGHVA